MTDTKKTNEERNKEPGLEIPEILKDNINELKDLHVEYMKRYDEHLLSEKKYRISLEAQEKASREIELLNAEWEKMFNQNNGVMTSDLKKLREKITVTKDLNASYPNLVENNKWKRDCDISWLGEAARELNYCKYSTLRKYTFSILKGSLRKSYELINAINNYQYSLSLKTRNDLKGEMFDIYAETPKDTIKKIITEWVDEISIESHLAGDEIAEYIRSISPDASYHEQYEESPARRHREYVKRELKKKNLENTK